MHTLKYANSKKNAFDVGNTKIYINIKKAYGLFHSCWRLVYSGGS